MDFSTLTDYELDKYVKAGNPDAIAELGRRRPAYSPQDQYNAQQRDKAANEAAKNRVWKLQDDEVIGQVPGDVATTQPVIVGGVNNAQVDVRPENTWNQDELMGQSIQNIPTVASESVPITEATPGGIQLFDDWVKTVPPEKLAQYTGEVPIPEDIPAKEPVNNRVFTVPKQKPAGMPSRVWEQLNPSQSTETTVTTINPEPTASQQNPYMGPTVQDPSSYSLANMDKLKTPEQLREEEEEEKKRREAEVAKSVEEGQKRREEARKKQESEERSKKIKDIVTKAAESDVLGDTSEQIASTTSAMLADAANIGGSVDPSGTSATLRAQADTAAKQAALMDARRQAADRIWNRDLKAEADKKAAAGAAAENAQRITSTAAGESTVGQRGVKAADYNYEENRADTARKEGTELSKDANQYQNAVYQRTMDAQKADYDYNENRKINNRIYQLTGGVGVKKDDGSYQVVGGNRDKDNNIVNPEQQPTDNNTQPTNNGNNNAQSDNSGNNSSNDNNNNNTVPTPTSSVPTPTSSVSTSTPGSNLANIQDKKQERFDKRDTATNTPQPATQSTDTASKQAAGVVPQSTEVPAYVSCLQRWYNIVSKIVERTARSGGRVAIQKQEADTIDQAIALCDKNRKPEDPQFNLKDYSRDNLLKVYNYVEPYIYKKGDK